MRLARSEFDTLALEHLDMLYRVANRLTRNSTAAEDLVQETYMRAFRAAETFELQDHGIRPWLIRIMHNLHFSRSQRERKQPMKVADEILQAAPDDSIAMTPTQGAALFEQLDDRMVAALDELPEEYKVVLLLWAVEELSYKEISAAVDVPIGTVMSRLHRAKARLADKLGDMKPKGGDSGE